MWFLYIDGLNCKNGCVKAKRKTVYRKKLAK